MSVRKPESDIADLEGIGVDVPFVPTSHFPVVVIKLWRIFPTESTAVFLPGQHPPPHPLDNRLTYPKMDEAMRRLSHHP